MGVDEGGEETCEGERWDKDGQTDYKPESVLTFSEIPRAGQVVLLLESLTRERTTDLETEALVHAGGRSVCRRP